MSGRAASAWRGPALLLGLSFLPVVAGAVRVVGFVSGAADTAADARFVRAPALIVVHAVSATLYAVLGALQFSPRLRGRMGAWHRRVGRVLAACGLLTAFTGVWMALQYDIPPALQGPLLQAVRVVVGAAMASSLFAGWRAILRRDVAAHEAWMTRAYALGQGAGTQALLLGPWTVVLGEVTGTTRDVLMSLAWALNALVAEGLLRRGGATVTGRAEALAHPA